MYEANRKFNDPVKLNEDIEQFFITCKRDNLVPTITGLAVALDTTRRTLLDYETEIIKALPDDIKKEISHTIKKAKQRIEAGYEQHLLTGQRPIGAIFTLKNNYNWQDKQEIVNTVQEKAPDLSGLSEEKIKEMLGE